MMTRIYAVIVIRHMYKKTNKMEKYSYAKSDSFVAPADIIAGCRAAVAPGSARALVVFGVAGTRWPGGSSFGADDFLYNRMRRR